MSCHMDTMKLIYAPRLPSVAHLDCIEAGTELEFAQTADNIIWRTGARGPIVEVQAAGTPLAVKRTTGMKHACRNRLVEFADMSVATG